MYTRHRSRQNKPIVGTREAGKRWKVEGTARKRPSDMLEY